MPARPAGTLIAIGIDALPVNGWTDIDKEFKVGICAVGVLPAAAAAVAELVVV